MRNYNVAECSRIHTKYGLQSFFVTTIAGKNKLNEIEVMIFSIYVRSSFPPFVPFPVTSFLFGMSLVEGLLAIINSSAIVVLAERRL